MAKDINKKLNKKLEKLDSQIELMDMADRIKSVMNEKGITQSELSRLTGINKGTINHYLKAKYNPRPSVICAIARALNVSEQWIMTGESVSDYTYNESQFIDSYRRLTPEHQHTLSAFMNSLAFTQANEEKLAHPGNYKPITPDMSVSQILDESGKPYKEVEDAIEIDESLIKRGD